jgi:hypothetical protein
MRAQQKEIVTRENLSKCVKEVSEVAPFAAFARRESVLASASSFPSPCLVIFHLQKQYLPSANRCKSVDS